MRNPREVGGPPPPIPLLLLLLLALPSIPAPAAAQPIKCDSIADTYFDAQHHHTDPSPYTGRNMVYFLHIPRTAGRTFHSCFLKLGTPPQRQCPNTYDHLRINVSMPNCFLLSSHDDFSVVSLLPHDIAVMTHIRDPVERFLSAYEFAVEVAARTFQRSGPPPRKDPRRINTEDVWPWSFLVPFFSKDMHERRIKLLDEPQNPEGNWIQVTDKKSSEVFYFNKRKEKSKWNLTAAERSLLLPPLDPYNSPLAMPLEEFVQHPIARELLHNGQAFQVLGITNYSHWGDAAQMRGCMWDSPSARTHLQEVALQRIGRFFHVGVTDRLQDSVAAAGVSMKFRMDQPVSGKQQQQQQQITTGSSRKGGGFHLASPSGEQVAKQLGNEKLAEDLRAVTEEVDKALHHMQSLKEQLFDNNQQGKVGAEKDALDAQIQQARSLLMERQAAMGKLQAQLGAWSRPPQRTNGTAGTLGVEFLKCARAAQSKNLERRARSFSHVFLMDGRGLRFSKGARKNIPGRVLDMIRQYNSMDLALHAAAENMLSTRREEWGAAGALQELPDLDMEPIQEQATTMAYKIPVPEKPVPSAGEDHETL